MTAEQFAYWMQGFSELTGDAMPTPAQWKMMKEHLATVFVKVTPPLRPNSPYPVIPYEPVIPYDWQRPLTAATPLRPLRSECFSGIVATHQGPITSIC